MGEREVRNLGLASVRQPEGDRERLATTRADALTDVGQGRAQLDAGADSSPEDPDDLGVLQQLNAPPAADRRSERPG